MNDSRSIGRTRSATRTCAKSIRRSSKTSMSSVAVSRARTSATRREDATQDSPDQEAGCGFDSPTSSEDYVGDRGDQLSRTSPELLSSDGCLRCGVTCTCLDIERAPFELTRETLGLPSPVPASLLLPRLTRKANQLSPSMRKWPGCRRLQEWIGTGGCPSPELAEWLMGFPRGWTE